jgi:anti-sigma-K factor RskA
MPREAAAAPMAPDPPERDDDFIPLRVEPPPPTFLSRPTRRIAPGWLAVAAALLIIGVIAGALVGRYLLADESEPGGQRIALQYPTDMKLDDATLTWLPNERVLRFSAPDMPAPPKGRVYQVWLIAGQDQPPTPVGTVDPATGQFATTIPSGREGTFAVTVEPGPLGSPKPTTDPVIVAPLG